MKQKFIEWFIKNNNGCSPAMEDDRSFVHEKTQHMFEAYQVGVAEGEARCAALAAENAGLKHACERVSIWDGFPQATLRSTGEIVPYVVAYGSNGERDYMRNIATSALKETPATDAFLAEVRASGADECVRQLVISDDDDFSDAPNVCAMVAHQLRQGGAV